MLLYNTSFKLEGTVIQVGSESSYFIGHYMEFVQMSIFGSQPTDLSWFDLVIFVSLGAITPFSKVKGFCSKEVQEPGIPGKY